MFNAIKKKQEKSINNRFPWWQDRTSNVYMDIGTWDLYLSQLVFDLTKVKMI